MCAAAELSQIRAEPRRLFQVDSRETSDKRHAAWRMDPRQFQRLTAASHVQSQAQFAALSSCLTPVCQAASLATSGKPAADRVCYEYCMIEHKASDEATVLSCEQRLLWLIYSRILKCEDKVERLAQEPTRQFARL